MNTMLLGRSVIVEIEGKGHQGIIRESYFGSLNGIPTYTIELSDGALHFAPGNWLKLVPDPVVGDEPKNTPETTPKIKKRDLSDVIEALLVHVPETEEKLVRTLKSIKDSANFCPPESMGVLWKRTSIVLMDEIGQPTEPWQKRVSDIFSGYDLDFRSYSE